MCSRGTASSKEVCYYCRALNVSIPDAAPDAADEEAPNPGMLFTAFGRNALHRSTLTNVDEFVAVHGATPFTTIPFFSVSRIFPDPMHIIDLTIVPDLAIALLLDWTDDKKFVDESSRQLRLQRLGEDYRSWVGNSSDRANQKLFTVDVLKPGSNAFAAVSQHFISAAAARGLLVWLSKVADHFASENPSREDLPRER
ncbi:unnamed protein product [Symbiodinium sp. CCMP2592]|nr:unnamed protein product [Symbiodinium sp. CCMP2592]